jgi:16S rRNA (cytosine967-C5)-methyltransferase
MPRLHALKSLNHLQFRNGFLKNSLRDYRPASHLSERDNALARELVYGVVRYYSTLLRIIDAFVRNQPMETVRNILALTIYQLFYLDKIPGYAAINEAVALAKKNGHSKQAGFINAVLRNMLRRKETVLQIIDSEDPAIRYAWPDWLVAEVARHYPQNQTNDIIRFSAVAPELTVKKNRHLSTATFAAKLAENNINYTRFGQSDWYRVHNSAELLRTSLLAENHCMVQDYSSGLAVQLFTFAGGNPPRILDMCAAPGGKSLQIMEMLSESGHLQANDADAGRIGLLTENLKRQHKQNYSVSNAPGEAISGRFTHILIDAPCSALGTLRKNPDVKWRRRQADIQSFQNTQLRLLGRAADLLAKDGQIVYTTCTILPSENEDVIDLFLQKNPAFRIDLPHLTEMQNYRYGNKAYLMLPALQHNGAYATRLIKSG